MKISEAQLFKQMEQGKLISSEVLPKVAAAYREAADAGGAYQLALKGLRVTEGQMVKSTQEAGEKIFQSGFNEGLSKLYETIAKLLANSGPQLEKIGNIFGRVFNAIAYTIKTLEPFVKVLISNFDLLFGGYMLAKVFALTKAMKLFGVTTAASFAVALAPITAIVTAITGTIAFIDDITSRFDANMSRLSASEIEQGYQTNFYGQRSNISEKDGKFYKGTTSKSTGLFGMNIHPESQGFTSQKAANSNVNNINLTVHGVTDDKMINRIHSELDKAMSGGMAPTSG